MNTYFVLLAIYVSWFVQPCPFGSERTESQISQARQVVSMQGIPREKAIAIAKQDALRSYKSLEHFTVVACELSIFWRIIFDGGGPEYVIDKESGAIRRVQKIPQDWEGQYEADSLSTGSWISKEEAIEIAKRDAETVPGVDIERFTITACELQKVWRVFVEFKLYLEPGAVRAAIPHSSAPNYVIDKKTGKILFKQRYGSAKRLGNSSAVRLRRTQRLNPAEPQGGKI